MNRFLFLSLIFASSIFASIGQAACKGSAIGKGVPEYYGTLQYAVYSSCQDVCTVGFWKGVQIDPSSCGACKTGAGLVASGMPLKDAVGICKDTLKPSAEAVQILIQNGYINQGNAQVAGAGVVPVCVGAASKFYSDYCNNP